jgi:hypothetical protein
MNWLWRIGRLLACAVLAILPTVFSHSPASGGGGYAGERGDLAAGI